MKGPFNKEDFIYVKDDLIKHVAKKGFDSINEYCVLSGIPLIVAYQYVKDELPVHTDKCDNKIKSISDFYGYGS